MKKTQIMDYGSLPHFCRREGSGSSRHSRNGTDDNCFSLDNVFHQQLYDFVKQRAALKNCIAPIKQGSFHVDFPEPGPEDTKIAETIQSEFQRLGDQNGLSNGLGNLTINGHWYQMGIENMSNWYGGIKTMVSYLLDSRFPVTGLG